MNDNRRILLCRRPRGRLAESDITLVSTDIPRPGEGELLVRNLYCGLDPAMRRWMDEDSYAIPIALGEAIRCTSVARVEESRNSAYRTGDIIIGVAALEDYSVVAPGGFTRTIDPAADVPLTRYLSLFGPNGMTAYFSLLEIGKPKPGDTVLVSAAAGSVGSLVGQIARIKGCRVVGIAGGAEKCARLCDEFGFDAAVDYKGRDLPELMADIRSACPAGVDVYFDNVGGLILNAALGCINPFARLVECGMISEYNVAAPASWPSNLWQIVAKAATMQGFLGRHYVDRFPEAMADLRLWAAEGRIHAREHVEHGLENFHTAFMRLFDGTNQGKLILSLAR